MSWSAALLETAATIALFVLVLAIGLTILRLIRGPHFADRAVAVDLLATLAVAFLGIYAIRFDHPVLIDVGLALALVSFVATVAFARFIERRQPTREGTDRG